MLIIFLYKCNQTLKICFLENRDIILRQVIKLVNKQTTQRLEMTQLECTLVYASVCWVSQKKEWQEPRSCYSCYLAFDQANCMYLHPKRTTLRSRLA